MGGKNIYDLCLMSIRDCFHFFETLHLSEQETLIAERVLKGKSRADFLFLLNVGMDYLNLARSTSTLSGGESQHPPGHATFRSDGSFVRIGRDRRASSER